MDVDLNDIHRTFREWMEKSADGLANGRFRFCLEGNLTPDSGRQALFSTCFAMKGAWQAGLWDVWPEDQRSGCIEFVRSFQREDGWFVDPWLRRASRPRLIDTARSAVNSLRGRSSGFPVFGRDQMNIRAETRQSVSTLLMVESTPAYSLPDECSEVKDVVSFIERLDWKDPWAAGSHLSHLLFMLTVNRTVFGIGRRYEELVESITEFLSSIRDPQTQCWYRGNPSDTIKMNGAMKVLTGLQWLDRAYPDCSKLMDFALSRPFERDGCGFLNRLYVVHEARKGAPHDYRSADIHALAERSLQEAIAFRKPDGGFAFSPVHAQTSYYGATVSEGLPVSDLHGAAMICWAIALCQALRTSRPGETSGAWQPHKA